ncbi:MAG: RNA polymerase sigma factor [Flavobacteriia bacterium]|jgi:RNA polymerase sigma factor (sigma-70 family)
MLSFGRKKYNDKTDEELVALYKQEKSSACIGVLYERYSHLVVGACMKYLKNPTDAEDVAMHIFEGLHYKLIKHEITFFKSWLYMVTKNECFMLLRKKGKEYSNGEISDLADDPISETATLEETKLKALEEILPSLNDDQRICIELFYLKDQSYQQISEELNMSLMRVKSAIQNGKRNLKIRLEERNEFKPET